MANQNFERAREFFNNPKNEGVDKIYITKDGNMFKAKHYAEDWAKGLDGKVDTISRLVVEAFDRAKASKEVVKVVDNEPEAEKEPETELDPTVALPPVADKEPEAEEEPAADKEPEAENDETVVSDEKEALVKRYIELYDTKPNHMTGIVKLKAKIAEKEAENAKAGIAD